jgi:sugar lactone lactonase YvrE
MDIPIIEGADVRCVLSADAIVGESPLWHATSSRLYWVDIQGKKIHRFDPHSGINQTFNLPDLVTCLAFRKTGGLLLTLRKNFAFYNPDSAKLTMLIEVEADQPTNRFNDGRCDPQGRFWAGTMSEKDWNAPAGALYRLDAARSCTLMQDQVVCSNGTAWSPDSRTMYHTESFRYAIFAYDFDPDTGNISNRRLFAQVDKSKGAFPDGLTVDSQGGIWSNHVGIGQVIRYLPNGKIDRIVQLPVPRATGCTFGGKNLDVLYVTTSRETMNAEQLLKAPLSGSLFAVKTGFGGMPASFFAG